MIRAVERPGVRVFQGETDDDRTGQCQRHTLPVCRALGAMQRSATLEVLEKSGGEGIILSVGGGTSPGMPRENIQAMLQALEEFNSKPVA